MALTVGTSGSNSVSTGGNSLTLSTFTVTAGTDLLAVFIGAGNGVIGTRTVSTVTWNGNSLTRLTNAASDDGNFLRTDIFYLLSPTAGTGDVIVTMGGSNLEIFLAAQNFSGANQSTPFGTPAKASSTANNSPTVNLTYNSGEYAFGVVASDANATITETGTLVAEAQAIGSDVCAGVQYFSGGGSPQAVSWSASTPDNGWAVTAVAVVPAGSGPGAGSDTSLVGVSESSANLIRVNIVEETS